MTPTRLISTASAHSSGGRQAAISSTRCPRTAGVLARLGLFVARVPQSQAPDRGAKPQTPRRCRGSPIGASRTRTGDLLGAIQGAPRLNIASLQGISPLEPGERCQKSSAICRISQEFWHAMAFAWPKLEPSEGGEQRCLRPPAQRTPCERGGLRGARDPSVVLDHASRRCRERERAGDGAHACPAETLVVNVGRNGWLPALGNHRWCWVAGSRFALP